MNVATYTRTAVPNPAARRWQQARCLQLADQLGLEATHEFHDDGKSCPTLDLLLPEIFAGSVSTLIIASIDRLGRSIADHERTSRALSEADVEVYAADMGPVPINPPMVQLLGVIAAADVEDDLAPTP